MATKAEKEAAKAAAKAEKEAAKAAAKAPAACSEGLAEKLNDPAFVAEQCEALSTDDFVIISTATPERLADISYMAAHAEDETLKAHCQRIVDNLPQYDYLKEETETEPEA